MPQASATPEVIDQILVIGQKRQPREACGVILPPDRVFELPNVARNPRLAYKVDNEDLIQLIAERFLAGDELSREDLIIWHTHPSGHIGPSQGDMESKAEGFRYLVVALPGGEASLF